MDTMSLRELKRRVSPMLLSVPGVSGVGVSGGQLRVYLESESPAVRKHVARAIEGVVKEGDITFEVVGTFRAAVPRD